MAPATVTIQEAFRLGEPARGPLEESAGKGRNWRSPYPPGRRGLRPAPVPARLEGPCFTPAEAPVHDASHRPTPQPQRAAPALQTVLRAAEGG